MKENLNRLLTRYQRTFSAFTAGQKVVAVIGTAALLLAGFMIFRWASTPNYAPLYADLASSDASAVIDKLDAQGIPYKLSNGGATVMVPKDQVYSSRIMLSGEGLPASSDSGYSILDKQSLSTSQFQEQTNFKRAMESELSRTIEAINGVQTAVVHLALPPKEVFADEQDPTTASVLIATAPGDGLDAGQVQAVVHLVASSVDGLDPEKVTVADATGQVLSAADDASGAAAANSRSQQVDDFEAQIKNRIQSMLDRVVGAGNSTVGVTANLDFDKAVVEKKSYTYTKGTAPLSETETTEKYDGAGGASGLTGVVGPDGQMDSTGTATGNGDGTYEKTSRTADNPVDTTVEHREAAPGSVENLNIGVVLDAETARSLNLNDIESMVTATAGIDPERGDLVNVSTMPFDRSAEEAAAAQLSAAEKADASARQWSLIRNGGIAAGIALALLLAWLKGRKRAKARVEATEYVVEQLKQEQLERQNAAAAQLEANAAMAALEATESNEADEMRDELAALVERQPEDVAALLRGWLVERS